MSFSLRIYSKRWLIRGLGIAGVMILFVYLVFLLPLANINPTVFRIHERKNAVICQDCSKRIDQTLLQIEIDNLENYLQSLFNLQDFKEFGKRQRHLFMLKELEESMKIARPSNDFLYLKIYQMIKEAEKMLFPWIFKKYQSMEDILKQSNGRGLVMSIGKHHFRFAKQAIKALRALGCDLPVEIMYIGPNDLTNAQIFELQSMDNVVCTDITQILDNDILKLSGWAIKPFSILASKFSQVILMDADTIFMKDPELLFDEDAFKTIGSIFYKDRTLFPNVAWQANWLHSFLPHPISEQVKSLRYYQERTAHEQDSAVVAINKPLVLNALLSVCNLNGLLQRELMYKKVHGDKETFWLGFALVNAPFYFDPNPSSAIGILRKADSKSFPHIIQGEDEQNVICGKVLHLHNGEPFWWNGGLDWDKYTEEGRLRFQTVDGYAQEGVWDFESSCVFNSPVKKLESKTSSLVNEVFRTIWSDINVEK